MKHRNVIAVLMAFAVFLAGCGADTAGQPQTSDTAAEAGETAEVQESTAIQISSNTPAKAAETSYTQGEVTLIEGAGEDNDPEASEKLNSLFDREKFTLAVICPLRITDGKSSEIDSAAKQVLICNKDIAYSGNLDEYQDICKWKHDGNTPLKDFDLSGHILLGGTTVTDNMRLYHGTDDGGWFTEMNGEKEFGGHYHSYNRYNTPYGILSSIKADKFTGLKMEDGTIKGRTMLSVFDPFQLIAESMYGIKGLYPGAVYPDIEMEVTITPEGDGFLLDAYPVDAHQFEACESAAKENGWMKWPSWIEIHMETVEQEGDDIRGKVMTDGIIDLQPFYDEWYHGDTIDDLEEDCEHSLHNIDWYPYGDEKNFDTIVSDHIR